MRTKNLTQSEYIVYILHAYNLDFIYKKTLTDKLGFVYVQIYLICSKTYFAAYKGLASALGLPSIYDITIYLYICMKITYLYIFSPFVMYIFFSKYFATSIRLCGTFLFQSPFVISFFLMPRLSLSSYDICTQSELLRYKQNGLKINFTCI